ncbi:sterol desaturase family protein [Aquimarina sp. MMG015]|nr:MULTISPECIES: sterol desaturase family protein [unclassified Aquimarina]AXT58167.1 sterol desaturase family protein [Aquimarina sp. AD1]MBQ4805005.1 sterol desaturase family protein [Aquimarina sp. MMG015]
MKHKIISLTAIPLLLVIISIIGFLTLENNWNFELTSYSVFLFTLFYILILERIIPLKKDWKPKKRLILTDIKHLVFSIAIFDALGKMFALSLTIYLQEKKFIAFDFWDSLPFIVVLIIANLIGDFLPYLYHRISHKGNPNSYISILLWKVHSIHHLPKSLNWFKTNWIHPINMFLNTFLKMTPILLLGFNSEIIFLVGIIHAVVAYISHANIKTAKSFWDYLIVTPQIHHFHHSANTEEAKNFGNTLPFWDLLFGTYFNRKGAVNKVGVFEEEHTDYPSDTNYVKQLLYPIKVTKKCCI